MRELEPKDVEILENALADTNSWSADALSSALFERGIEISGASIQRHRVNRCRHN